MSMKVVFFEVQEWEKDILAKHHPDALITEEKLNQETAVKYQDAEVTSCFIYSSVTKKVLDLMPSLKCIATRSTGFDHIDVASCHEKKIVVSNVPEYGSVTVAEHTFGLILTLSRKLYQSINQARELNFDHAQIRGVDLFGKTLGIIGLGKIGKHILKIAQGFGMKVIVYNRSQDATLSQSLHFSYVNLDQLVSQSDFITLHLPLSKETMHIINKDIMMRFKRGSFLVNTARGGLVDTEALVMGLEKGILRGVALDVMEGEKDLNDEITVLTSEYKKEVDLKTLVLDHILMRHPNVIITPHNAFNSEEAITRIAFTTIGNIKSFISGIPINTV